MEVFWTIISGVLVYVLSEIAKQHLLDPYHEYMELRGEVAYTISYYRYVLMNPIVLNDSSEATREERNEVSDEIRGLACKVIRTAESRYCLAMGIPAKKVLHNVGAELIGLSNSLTCTNDETKIRTMDQNDMRCKNICHDLKLSNKG